MKLFTIPPWDEHIDIKHVATSWKISNTIDMTSIITESVEDAVNVISYSVNIEVPEGETYYISALRHLEDIHGDAVNYTNWLEPVAFTSDSIGEGILIEQTHIAKPFLEDITIDNVGLHVKLSPYEGTGTHTSTVIVILGDNKEVFVKTLLKDTDADLVNFTIPTIEANFKEYEKVTIKVMFTNNTGLMSYMLSEDTSYGATLFKVIGKLHDINPYIPEVYDIVNTGNTNVRVRSAVVFSLAGVIVFTPTIDAINNQFKFTSGNNADGYLDKDTTYKLTIGVDYIDESGNLKELSRDYYISTMSNIVSRYTDIDVTYINKLIEVEDSEFNIASTQEFNTEQNLEGIIPFIDTNLVFARYNDTTKKFNILHTTNIVGPTGSYVCKYLPLNRLLIISTDKVQVVDYKHGTIDNLEVTEHVVSFNIKDIENDNFTYIDGSHIEVFTNDNNTFVHKQFNFITGELITLFSKEMTDITTCTSISANLVGGNNILIVPNSPETMSAFNYSITYGTLEKSINILEDFRHIQLSSYNLLNGNIVYFKREGTTKLRTFMVFNKDIPSMVEHIGLAAIDSPLSRSINYRSSEIDFIDNDGKIIRYN